MEKEAAQGCLMGHEDRLELDEILKLPRPVRALKDFKVKINLGAGQCKRTSVKDLAEDYKASEEGQLLWNGGSLTVPVVDYVKEKFKLKSVDTLERMETFDVARQAVFVDGLITIGTLHKVGA